MLSKQTVKKKNVFKNTSSFWLWEVTNFISKSTTYENFSGLNDNT